MRTITLSGRKAGFGAQYREATDNKSAFAVAFINVSLERKDEGDQYTKTMPVKLLANGYLADRLNQFENGEMIYLTGELDLDNDWTDSEGNIVKGQMYVRVNKIDNWPANYNSNSAQSASAPAKAAGKPAKPATKPAGRKPAPPKPSVAR